jgi:L-iditol 2-dehydrogenase
MKAAVYNADMGIFELLNLEQPEIADDEVLLKSMSVGVCSSELTAGKKSTDRRSMGHEVAGIVHKAGSEVKRFKEGDRVFVHHHVPCFVCHHCRRGHFTMCPEYPEFAFDPGGYAEYTRVKSRFVRSGAIKLPDHISFDEGCLIEPLACIWDALKKAPICPGDAVHIIGAGFIGLSALQLARCFSQGPVTISDDIESKLKTAAELGADRVINRKNQDVVDEIGKINEGRGPDIVMVTAPGCGPLAEGISIAGRGGTVIHFGYVGAGETLPVEPYRFMMYQLTLFGTYSASSSATHEVAEVLFNGRIDMAPLISHYFKLDGINRAMELKRSSTEALKVIVHPNGQD